MIFKSNFSDIYLNRTRSAYMWTRILNIPFWALYSMLPFILYKDLHASAWQVALLVSLKPVVSLFSLYWSSLIKRRSDRLVSNVIWAGLLGHLPFFFFPWANNPWFFLWASGIYMIFHRGANPAWMEILKINIPEESRKKVFAYASTIYHLGGAILPLGMGWILDDYYQSWRWLFPLASIISLGAIALQALLPLRNYPHVQESVEPSHFSLWHQFKKPWLDAWELIRQRPDFARFQIGFMLGGGGLMLWQPVLPVFFVDTLHISYVELTIALTLCKGIGYSLASPLWTRGLGKLDIFLFSSLVTALAALFPIALIAAQWHLSWLYAGYLLYGIMQAGSELSWNLSGPIFAKHEDSSLYTGVNVVTIGLRGCVGPPLGSFLCHLSNAFIVLLMGGGLCLLATWQMCRSRQKEEQSYAILADS